MSCVPFEFSNGAIILIALVAFWLGLCFVVGMQSIGKHLALALLEVIRVGREELHKHGH